MFKSFVVLVSLFLLNSCNEIPSELTDSKIKYVRSVWIENPSHEMIIGWGSYPRSNRDDRYIVYDTVDHGSETDKYSYKLAASSFNYYKGMRNTFVKFKNLEANTKYFFKIIDNSQESRRYWFQTASNDQSEIIIIAGGDSRNNRDIRQLANKLVGKLRPHAVMFGGDYTNLGTRWQWQKWFEDWELTISKDGKLTPIIPARGNHEREAKTLENLFLVPEKNYYSISFGNDFLNIITLDTNASTEGHQKEWLKEVLTENANHTHKFVQYHQPMRPHVKSKKEGDHYSSWSKIFWENRIDLVMESDSHMVKETYPIRPSQEEKATEGFIRDDEGIIFLGEGCWGAPLRSNDDDKPWTKKSSSFNQFKWIKVSSDKYQYKTIIIDEYIETVPETSNPYQLSSEIKTWN